MTHPNPRCLWKIASYLYERLVAKTQLFGSFHERWGANRQPWISSTKHILPKTICQIHKMCYTKTVVMKMLITDTYRQCCNSKSGAVSERVAFFKAGVVLGACHLRHSAAVCAKEKQVIRFQPFIGDLYIDFYNTYFLDDFRFCAKMAQIWVLIGRRCSLTTPRHFWAIFEENMYEQPKILKRPRAGKPFFFFWGW